MFDHATGAAGVQFQSFIDLLFTPVGFIGLGVFILLLIAVLIFKWARWGVISLLLYVATFGVSSSNAWFNNTFSFPLEQIRDQGRTLCAALLLALLVPSLVPARGRRHRLILGGTLAFFVLELVFTGRLLIAGNAVRGVVGGTIFLLVFLTFALGLSQWIQTRSDVIALLRCITVASILLLLGTMYQLALNSSAIISGGRLYATTPNPQHAALVLAIALIPTCYLLVRREEPKTLRILWGITTGFLVLFLIWTGSRTGLLMAVVGLGLLFRLRIGKLLGAGIVVALVILVGLQFFGASTESAGRLLSTQNTRAVTWGMMLRDFITHPLYGYVPPNDTPSIAENSYLSTAGRLGVIGLTPLLLMMILIGRSLLKLRGIRRSLGSDALLADLVIAAMISMAAGAFFEGFILGTMTNMVFCIYIYLAILAFLLDMRAEDEDAALAEGHPLHSIEMAGWY